MLDPVCHYPKSNGRKCLNPATVADHIIPLRQRPDLRLKPENGQGLCHWHHNVKTTAEIGGGQVVLTRPDLAEWLALEMRREVA